VVCGSGNAVHWSKSLAANGLPDDRL